MATIQLNIYAEKDKSKIEKTYTAETYDLMLGTVEDLMQVIDLDKINDKKAVAVMVAKGFNLLKPFIKDIFDGVTDAELKRVKVKELIPLFMQIGEAILESLDLVKTKN